MFLVCPWSYHVIVLQCREGRRRRVKNVHHDGGINVDKGAWRGREGGPQEWRGKGVMQREEGGEKGARVTQETNQTLIDHTLPSIWLWYAKVKPT